MKETEKKKEVTAKSITKQLKEVQEKNAKAQVANDKRLYARYKKQIETAYGKMETCYLDTAVAIHSIYQQQLYKLDNYKNIYDFAKENYDISRGTCSKFINICERFGAINENGNVIGLQERFENFGVSQLGAMLPMPDCLLEQCDCKMSVRALKQLCEDYKESLNAHQEVLEGAEIDVVDSENIVDTGMNEPVESVVDVTDNKTFVCQASTFEEFAKLQDVIKESFEDVLKKYPHAKISVDIIF